MATYKEIQNQIAELQRAAEEARTNEVQGAVEKIKSLMADYGLSIDDIVGTKRRGGKAKTGGKVQFRDDQGNTWSGRGRMPGWLHGKDKEQYRLS
jgi:DNA-binding protein H-NS